MVDKVIDSYTGNGETKYFFVNGNFNEFTKRLSENFFKGLENIGVYPIGSTHLIPVPQHKAILIKGYYEGFDNYIKKEFGCELF
jgi:hypothetical protein